MRAYHASNSTDRQVRASWGQRSSPVFSTADVAGLRGIASGGGHASSKGAHENWHCPSGEHGESSVENVYAD